MSEPAPEPRPPTTGFRETSPSDLDRALTELGEAAPSFARTSPADKARLLADVVSLLVAGAPAQVAEACAEKGIPLGSPLAGEEWLAGPYAVVHNARLLVESLVDIDDFGRPLLSRGALRTRDDGRAEVQVIPGRASPDRWLYRGQSAVAVMQEGVTRDDVTAEQARAYQVTEPAPGISLVLGAGNVASIPAMDALHRLFVENRVVILKMSPVNAYLGPHIERAFAPLVDKGFLRVVYGGADAGAYLAHHPAVTDAHVTGSDRTHDLMVWGEPGPERERRKAAGDPLLKKPVTSELGNVSPVIVLPFLYDKDELWYQVRSICSQVVNNASFNCNAAKMLVLPAAWPQRPLFLDMLRKALGAAPTRRAYYPGARERYARLTEGRERVERFGAPAAEELPWALVLGLDPRDEREPLFVTEPFCGIVSEVTLTAHDPIEFVAEAAAFCNERLWGTLSASLVVHPLQAADPAIGGAVEAAIGALRYGAVAVNTWPAMIYGAPMAPWGAHPSGTLADIKSGIGFVHNTAMLNRVEKVVLRASLRALPAPPYFLDNRAMARVGERLVGYAADPSWRTAFSVLRAAFP